MSYKRLLVFSPLYPPHVGGLESHAEQFNQHMTKEGYGITVFTPLIVRESAWQENCDGVKIIRFPAFEIIPNYPVPKIWLPFFWKQWHQIWKQDFNIIISRTRFFLTSLMAMFYSKVKRKPWLHIEHGSDFVHLNNNISSLLAKLYDITLGKLIFLTADKIVANSKASASFVKKLAPNCQVDVIYRGVDSDALQKIVPNKLFRTQNYDKFLVTYCGRLIDGKGVADLLSAVALIKIPNVLCLIIGDGPQKNKLITLADFLQIRDRIRFLGELSWSEAISYIKISDIIVNPSYTEGLPTSVIEASLCHRAIIATGVGGTAEIISHNESGWFYAPHDICQLSLAIEALASNSRQREQLGQHAYISTATKFSWKISTERYGELLHCLARSTLTHVKSSLIPVSLELLGINFIIILFYVLGINLPFSGLLAVSWQSLAALLMVFVLTGLNFPIFLQVIIRQRLSRAEYFSVAIPAALIIPPFILAAIYQFQPLYVPSAVWLIALSSFLPLALLSYRQLLSWPERVLQKKSWLSGFKKIVNSPVTWAISIYCALYFAIVLAYRALPDLDPYTWLGFYKQYFQNGSPVFNDRSLFLYFIFLINRTAGIPLYDVFKYGLPALALLLPGASIILNRHQKNRLAQFLIALWPLATASGIVYLFLPIPQTVAIILLCYCFYWVVYAHYAKRPLFFYLAGAVAFMSYFYHEISIFFFAIWLILSSPRLFYLTYQRFRRDLVTSLLLGLLILTNFSIFTLPYYFFRHFFIIIFPYFHIQFNWLFPARYIDIDNLEMGWSNATGVLKYYLYYVGPAVVVVLTTWVITMLCKKSSRYWFWRNLRSSLSFRVLVSIFIFFVSIAEIFPRVFNISLLPERAWVFAGIFSGVFLFALFDAYPRHIKGLAMTGILLISISVSGAVYINSEKRFLITDYQVDSAQWIVDHLPANRTILTSTNNRDLIIYHASSKLIYVSTTFFCDDPPPSDEAIKKMLWPASATQVATAPPWITELKNYLNSSTKIERETILSILGHTKEPVSVPLETTVIPPLPAIYIYYSPLNPRNLYASRPYQEKKEPPLCSQPILDKYPDRYQKIYDDHGRVKIWKVL